MLADEHVACRTVEDPMGPERQRPVPTFLMGCAEERPGRLERRPGR
jgi:hypothetical protein